MAFGECNLSEIADIFSGFAFKSKDLKVIGIPVIKIANIQNKRVTKKCPDNLPEELFSARLSRYLLQRNDCLVAMTGAGSVGKFGKMWNSDKPYLVNQRVGIIRPNIAKCNPEYLYHVLSLNHYEDILYKLGLGAGQPNISVKEIGSLLIPFPDIDTQCKTASILSAYDDLIENNLRRIKILEEMAKTIYDEWFVKFRFPGYEKVKMVDSELGPIPEGWEIVKFTEMADVLSGGTPSTKRDEFWGEEIAFFTPKDATECWYAEETEKRITLLGLTKCNSKLYPKNTIFITARGTVGKVVLAGTDMAMNQSCYALIGKDGLSHFYLFLATRANVERLRKGASGATFDAITVDSFDRLPILKADSNTLTTFVYLIEPMFDRILNLLRVSRHLKKTRDLLLPKLISGEIDSAVRLM